MIFVIFFMMVLGEDFVVSDFRGNITLIMYILFFIYTKSVHYNSNLKYIKF